METRPIPEKIDNLLKDVPADRTAVWQDLMMLKNTLGPDQKIIQRKVVLKGHPRVVDRLQQQSIDAVDTITTWLKPKPPATSPAKTKSTTASSVPNSKSDSTAEGENFQIERLLAIRDVHLVAPSKHLTARDRLDASFQDAPSPAVATRTTVRGTAQPAAEASSPAEAAPEGADTKAAESENASKEKEPEPAMVAYAHRVEADIQINPKGEIQGSSKKGGSAKTAKASPSPSPGDPDSDYEVRDMRLYGAVRLHQEPSPGKTKGQDAACEKLVLHNEGPGRAVVDLYDREDASNGELALATPRPPAKVVTEDMYIEGPILKLNQITDEAKAFGPGKLIQYTDRASL